MTLAEANLKKLLKALRTDRIDDTEIVEVSANRHHCKIQLAPAAWVARGLPPFDPIASRWGMLHAKTTRHGAEYCSCATLTEIRATAAGRTAAGVGRVP